MKNLKIVFIIFIGLVGAFIVWMWIVSVFQHPVPQGVTSPPIETKADVPVKEEVLVKEKVPVKSEKETIVQKVAPPEEEPTLVRVVRAALTDFQDVLPVMGTVKGTEEIDLRFEVNGVVSVINFREGEKVRKGDLISSLDQKDAILRLEYARSKLTTAENNFLIAKKKLEVYEGLYDVGVIIKPKLEEIRLEVESAKLQVGTAKVELELANSELKKTSLFAPRDGVIGEMNAEVGEYVTPNIMVVSLIKIDDVFVEVGVIEKDIDKVELGQRAVVTVDTYPEMNFKGKVENIFSVVEGKSRTLTTKIKIANPESLLLPGMFARVGIYLADIKNTLIVPRDSLIELRPGFTVLPVVSPQGHSVEDVKKGSQPGLLELRKVTLGYASSDYVQIISGLNKDDLVVTEVQGDIKENMKVRIVGVVELGL